MADLRSLGGRKPLPADLRFDASYIPEPNSGCWLWLGAERGSNGYGSIVVQGKRVVAHRYAFERFIGPLAGAAIVCHKCDNPACVNPSHLFLGTLQSNSDDKVAKGRQARGALLALAQQNCKRRGEKNGNSKLTEVDVLSIFSSADPQRKIAASFGITQAMVSSIKTRKAWRWLTNNE